MLRVVTQQPPPPSGQPGQPGQPDQGHSAPSNAYGPPPGALQSGAPQAGPPGYPPPPGYQTPQPYYAQPAAYLPPPGYGTNGFAIVALICALTGFFPVAIIFGILSLRQLRRRPQTGRGMAISGIVLGSLGTLFVGAVIAFAIMTSPERDAEGRVVAAGSQSIESLKVGDCFNGVEEGRSPTVTAVPCGTPHEAEVGAIVTLPDTPFPGADEAAAVAEEQCIGKLEPLIREDRFEDVDLFYVYPNSSFAWKTDRSTICIVIGLDGRKLTGSALQTTGGA